MKGRWKRKYFSYLALVPPLLLLLPACFYRINLEPPYALKIDPQEYQPVGLLPISPAPDSPNSGTNLYSFIRDALEGKGYLLVKEADVTEALQELKLSPLHLLSDPQALQKLGEHLKAKVVFIGTIPEYRVQKSSWGARTVQVWGQEPYDSLTLPTYYQGTCRLRLILRMFESEKGDLVWAAEGTIRASSDSAETYARKLAERLLKELPPVSPGKRD